MDDFIKKVYMAARRLWKEQDGVHPLFITAQAALETGWKLDEYNNLFGIIQGSSWTGDTALRTTTEYYSRPDVKFKAPEEVLSVVSVPGGVYKYLVKRYFRVYPSIDACLNDHFKILSSKLYADAWPFRNDPWTYATKIVDGIGAKYATSPFYAQQLKDVMSTVARHYPEARNDL